VEAQKTDVGITHIKEHMAMDPTTCFHMDNKGILWFKNRLVVPKVPELRQRILDESHTSWYSIHPRSNKMYQDLKSRFWWTKMKIEIARYVARCDICQRVKAIHLRSTRPLQSLPIPEGKWEDISMDFIIGLPKTSKGYDSIWVIVDCFTKVAHFLPMRTLYPTKTYVELYIARIMSLHGVPKTIVSDRGPQFVSRFWEEFHKSLGTKLIHSSAYHPQTSGQTERVNQILEDMLQACVLVYSEKWDECLPLAKFSYNNSYQESIQIAPFEALYGQRCRTPINWSGPGERLFFGLDLVKEVEEKVKLIQHRLKVAQHHHKHYADQRRRPLFFQVGDFVYLKVSPMKGVNRFGIKGKLAPRYVGPFEILARCGAVAYKAKYFVVCKLISLLMYIILL
jgi:transposase InsO family protein